MTEKRYPTDLDPRQLEPCFSDNLLAMTVEDLHSKAEIAVQLAWRDQQIRTLKYELYDVSLALWQHRKPFGYDANGRTFSDTPGFCSHFVDLTKPCRECELDSERPVPP